MTLIRNDEDADRLAGEERLQRPLRGRGQPVGLASQLAALGRECAVLPDLFTRTPDEIVGYDAAGMWR